MSKAKQTPPIIKIFLGGEGGVGKSSLLYRLMHNRFEPDMPITVGVDVVLYELTIKGRKVVLQIWDLGGQERFQFMHDSYVFGARGGLILYDLTRPETLEDVTKWVKICRTGCGVGHADELPLLLVGTKSDRLSIDEFREKFGLESCDLNGDSNVDFSKLKVPIEASGVYKQNEFTGYNVVSSATGSGIKETLGLILAMILQKDSELAASILKSGQPITEGAESA